MLGEFLLRLAVALPLICGLAALTLYAAKRGWLRLPGLARISAPQPSASGVAAPLTILSVKSLSPAARVAVVRFADRDLLIGISGQGLHLLGEAGSPSVVLGPSPLQEITR